MAWEAVGNGVEMATERVDHVSITATSIYGDTLFTGPVARDSAAARPSGVVTFEAPAGSVRIRLEAQNSADRRVDSSDLSVEVPDFLSPRVQLSTPMVFRGRTVRELQQLRAAAAPLPAISRAFARTERVLIRLGAYGPGESAPLMAARLLNRSGAAIATLPVPARVADTRDYEVELSLAPFPPGDYLVEIVATVGDETIKKLVALRVTG